MNILMVGPAEDNPTDGVIIRGIKYILRKNYGGCNIDYVYLNDIKYQFKEDFNLGSQYQLIVVSGTPWLWDSFQNSIKYLNLKRCFETHPNAKRLFMGVGSCLSLDAIDHPILKRPEEVEGIKELFSNATVITRDSVALDRLLNAGIKAVLLPCPAYYCYEAGSVNCINRPELDVLIYTDPKQTISSVDWQDESKLAAYNNEVMDFYHMYRPEVCVAFEHEVEAAINIGLPRPRVLRNSRDTLNTMLGAKNVLSGRVHCAVPARVVGANVKLMPIDSRYLVVEDFKDITDFSPYLEYYKEILRKI